MPIDTQEDFSYALEFLSFQNENILREDKRYFVQLNEENFYIDITAKLNQHENCKIFYAYKISNKTGKILCGEDGEPKQFIAKFTSSYYELEQELELITQYAEKRKLETPKLIEVFQEDHSHENAVLISSLMPQCEVLAYVMQGSYDLIVINQRYFFVDMLDRLGAGGYGVVYCAYEYDLETGETVRNSDGAPKKLAIKMANNDLVSLRTESEYLKRYYANFSEDILLEMIGGFEILIMPFFPGNELKNFLASASGRRLLFPERIELVREIATAFNMMSHATKSRLAFLHSDIKPGNIRLDVIEKEPLNQDFPVWAAIEEKEGDGASVVVKLGERKQKQFNVFPIDFGLAASTDDNPDKLILASMRGTPEYTAHELLFKRIGLKSDVFSLGLMFCEILLPGFEIEGKSGQGENRFKCCKVENREATKVSMISSLIGYFKDHLELNAIDFIVPSLCSFLFNMISLDYSDRPSMDEVTKFFNILAEVLAAFILAENKEAFLSDAGKEFYSARLILLSSRYDSCAEICWGLVNKLQIEDIALCQRINAAHKINWEFFGQLAFQENLKPWIDALIKKGSFSSKLMVELVYDDEFRKQAVSFIQENQAIIEATIAEMGILTVSVLKKLLTDRDYLASLAGKSMKKLAQMAIGLLQRIDDESVGLLLGKEFNDYQLHILKTFVKERFYISESFIEDILLRRAPFHDDNFFQCPDPFVSYLMHCEENRRLNYYENCNIAKKMQIISRLMAEYSDLKRMNSSGFFSKFEKKESESIDEIFKLLHVQENFISKSLWSQPPQALKKLNKFIRDYKEKNNGNLPKIVQHIVVCLNDSFYPADAASLASSHISRLQRPGLFAALHFFLTNMLDECQDPFAKSVLKVIAGLQSESCLSAKHDPKSLILYLEFIYHFLPEKAATPILAGVDSKILSASKIINQEIVTLRMH